MTRARTRAARPSNPARARSGAAAAAGGCACALSKSPSLRRLLVSSLLMRRTLSAVAPAAFCTASSALAAAVWRFCPAASASSCACICSRLLRASSLSPAALRLPPTSPVPRRRTAVQCSSLFPPSAIVCGRSSWRCTRRARRPHRRRRTHSSRRRTRTRSPRCGRNRFCPRRPRGTARPGLKAGRRRGGAVAGRRRQPARQVDGVQAVCVKHPVGRRAAEPAAPARVGTCRQHQRIHRQQHDDQRHEGGDQVPSARSSARRRAGRRPGQRRRPRRRAPARARWRARRAPARRSARQSQPSSESVASAVTPSSARQRTVISSMLKSLNQPGVNT